MLRRFFYFLLILPVAAACSRDETPSAHPRTDANAARDGVPPRPAVIKPLAQAYRVVAVSGGGTITGTVDFDGPPPAQIVVRPTSDQNICGSSITEKNIALSG